jgi:predicted transcriptional regulator
MTPEKLQEIKDKLSVKAVRRIADKSGYSLNTVYDVLKGRFNNLKVLSAIVEVYEEEMALLKELEERIEKAES